MTVKYIVSHGTLKYNDKNYLEWSIVELDAKTGANLEKQGIVELMEAEESNAQNPEPQEDLNKDDNTPDNQNPDTIEERRAELEKLKVAELKQLLDEMEIWYSSDNNKSDLIDKVILGEVEADGV